MLKFIKYILPVSGLRYECTHCLQGGFDVRINVKASRLTGILEKAGAKICGA